jgi:hypothetical protein
MLAHARRLVVLALLGLVALGAEAAALSYRWVDEQGTVHYAARRDQVPERYREQLGPRRPGEPPTPRLTPNATRGAGAPHGCILRLRGTEKTRGSSASYPSCDSCRQALETLGDADARRAECFASSLEDELGQGSR